MACEETITSLIDSMWVIRDSLLDNRIVIGGGATEIELYRFCMKYATERNGIERIAIRAWGNALLSIPSTLAENSGLPPMETTNQLISDHEKGLVYNGVDAMNSAVGDLKEVVWEPMKLRESILLSATEVVSMVLKIDDVINT